MNRLRILCLLLVIGSIRSYSQIIQYDTVRIAPNYIICFLVPGHYKVKTTLYEEGVFKDILVYKDNVVLSFHFGAMNYESIDKPANEVSDFKISGLLRDRKYKYIENNEFFYKREINIFPYNLDILYDRVPENKLNEYDEIFSNLKIFKTK